MLSPHVRQYLRNKIQEEHWQTIGEQDATLSLYNNDLKDLEKKKHDFRVKFMQKISRLKNVKTPIFENVM